MSFARGLKRHAKAAIAPMIFLALTGYFGWQVTQGDRGVQAYPQRLNDFKAATAELDRVTAEHDVWDRRVAALRNDHLDSDALDERVRAMLNMTNPADITIPYPAGQKLF